MAMAWAGGGTARLSPGKAHYGATVTALDMPTRKITLSEMIDDDIWLQ